jgi:predicted nuclease of predicted toxin-antitoxin system
VKLLFDQNISFRVVQQINNIFPEAKHVKDFELQFAFNQQIWAFAKANEFSIVTFDSDFYDLITLKGHPPKIIWLRIGNTTSLNLANVITKHQFIIQSFLKEERYKEIGCLEITL